MPSPEQLHALAAVAPCCVACEQEFDIPAGVTAAQWATETGWGRSMPDGSNNPFGIKSYPGCAGEVLAQTREWFTPVQLHQFLRLGKGRTARPDPGEATKPDGHACYIVQDLFACFPTLEEAFRHRAQLLTTSPLYRGAVTAYRVNRDPSQFIDAIAQHYATDPGYAHLLKTLAFGPAITQAVVHAQA
jgi:flagellum-specific peptidoglycan hydrolase FlgJ